MVCMSVCMSFIVTYKVLASGGTAGFVVAGPVGAGVGGVLIQQVNQAETKFQICVHTVAFDITYITFCIQGNGTGGSGTSGSGTSGGSGGGAIVGAAVGATAGAVVAGPVGAAVGGTVGAVSVWQLLKSTCPSINVIH